jgi:hypothetical protein
VVTGAIAVIQPWCPVPTATSSSGEDVAWGSSRHNRKVASQLIEARVGPRGDRANPVIALLWPVTVWMLWSDDQG